MNARKSKNTRGYQQIDVSAFGRKAPRPRHERPSLPGHGHATGTWHSHSADGRSSVLFGMDKQFVLSCIAVIALAAVLIFGIVSCSGGCAAKGRPAGGEKYGMPNWTELDSSSLSKDSRGRYTYTEDGKVRSLTGVDVSDHQEEIDWQRVAADGVDFTIVRLGSRGTTEGGITLDDYFARNLSGARDAGLAVGVYFFSQALTEDEAREEANFVVTALASTKLDYPVVYDLELSGNGSMRADNLSSAQATACAKAFCEVIAKAGYTPMIYGGTDVFARYDLRALNDYPRWFAAYTAKPDTAQGFNIWQYTDNGTVDGMDEGADLSIQFLPEDTK